MDNFPDVTIPPETDHSNLLNKLQRFFVSAMPFWKKLAASSTSAGVDHGLLGGLADDDHTQYLNTARHTALAGDHVENGDLHDHSGGDGAQISHAGLSNLTTGDAHTQYDLLAGRSGGQTSYGGTASGDDRKIISTAHATKGSIYIGGDGGTTNYSEFEADGTLRFAGAATVWDDIRINPGNFDRPGGSDPAPVTYYPNGGGLGVSLYEFAINNWVSFTVQLPHGYKTGTDIYVHLHWTPGNRGNEENGATVGWKIDYAWANIDANFPSMLTADLSDACDGVDHKHQMTPEVTIDGHTVAKGISSMLICNLRRSDTGADDTWASGAAGQLPMILEVDFHYEIDTVGSRGQSSK